MDSSDVCLIVNLGCAAAQEESTISWEDRYFSCQMIQEHCREQQVSRSSACSVDLGLDCIASLKASRDFGLTGGLPRKSLGAMGLVANGFIGRCFGRESGVIEL